MSEQAPASPVSLKSILVAFAVLAALAYSTKSGAIVGPYLDNEFVRGVPYLRSALITVSDALIMFALIALTARGSGAIFKLTGLAGEVGRPLLWAIAVLAPSIALAVAFAAPGDFDLSDVAWLSIGSPIMEEITYRGLAIGALMRICGWPFLAAALAPAAFFGLAHVAQGEGLGEIAGVVAITGLGGLLFGWLFVRWGFNLWPAIFLHVGMNAIWLVFNLGENAIGGWFGNAQRLLVVALAIGLTILMAPRSARLGAPARASH